MHTDLPVLRSRLTAQRLARAARVMHATQQQLVRTAQELDTQRKRELIRQEEKDSSAQGSYVSTSKHKDSSQRGNASSNVGLDPRQYDSEGRNWSGESRCRQRPAVSRLLHGCTVDLAQRQLAAARLQAVVRGNATRGIVGRELLFG